MIFPDWETAPAETAPAPLPLFSEWAMDWNNHCFALQDGQPYLLTGTEALKIWVRCALHPENHRFRFSAHSADYGNSLSALLEAGGDTGILESCLCREIRETLLVCPYILDTDNFSFSRTGSRITIRFSVHTVYENFDEEVSIAHEL